MVVEGTPVGGEGGQGGRDEDDPLLAPMPSGGGGPVPGTPSTIEAGPDHQPTSQPSGDLIPVLVASGVGLLAVAVGLVAWRRRAAGKP